MALNDDKKAGSYMGAGAAIAGAAISAGGGIVGNILNHDIAEQNLRLQQEQFEYQKQLNEQTMLREDTAHQREVADLIASGLSPLQSSGSGASSSSLTSAPAPQNQFKVNPLEMAQLSQIIAQGRKSEAEAVLMEKQAGTFNEEHDMKMRAQAIGIELDKSRINQIDNDIFTDSVMRELDSAIKANDIKAFEKKYELLSIQVANEILKGQKYTAEGDLLAEQITSYILKNNLLAKDIEFYDANQFGRFARIFGSIFN